MAGLPRVVQPALSAAPKEPVPLWRWAIWWICLGAAVVLFYVLLTPIWLGLRGLARLADLRRRVEGS